MALSADKHDYPIDFLINDNGPVSAAFLELYCNTFVLAAQHIRHIPYGRNKAKSNLLAVLIENIGTCSTKHALLKSLADEQGYKYIKLYIGIFKMSPEYSKKIEKTLSHYGLDYIPEAHTYIKYQDAVIDCTTSISRHEDFAHLLLDEIEISPSQIPAFKVMYHRQFLKQWITHQSDLNLELEGLWEVREQCIRDLSK